RGLDVDRVEIVAVASIAAVCDGEQAAILVPGERHRERAVVLEARAHLSCVDLATVIAELVGALARLEAGAAASEGRDFPGDELDVERALVRQPPRSVAVGRGENAGGLTVDRETGGIHGGERERVQLEGAER